MSAAKRKGTQWESDLIKFFRTQGLDAERLAPSGANDEGDIILKAGTGFYKTAPNVVDMRPLPFVIEAKACKTLDLAGWVGQAEVEAVNYAKHRGIELPGFVVVHKRRNHNIAKSYVTTTLAEWLRQIDT